MPQDSSTGERKSVVLNPDDDGSGSGTAAVDFVAVVPTLWMVTKSE